MNQKTIKFQGSPQKFGKAAYCDLSYTQSKLYDHVLTSDLITFKQIWNYKTDLMCTLAIKDLWQNKYAYLLQQKGTVIQCLNNEIHLLKNENRRMMQKNIQRTQRIINSHNISIQTIIKQKQEQVCFIQSQKQLLEQQISSLKQKLQSNKNLIQKVQKQRQQINQKQRTMQQLISQVSDKLKQKQQELQQSTKNNEQKINKLHQQKLEIQLYFKKLMVERGQQNKYQLEKTIKSYQLQIQNHLNHSLAQSLKAKQCLSKVLNDHERQNKQNRQKITQLQFNIQDLRKSFQYQKQRSHSIELQLELSDKNLSKYQNYLQQSDQTIKKLRDLLMQCQQQLQKAKISLQKNAIQKQSINTRIKICEQEARMWRESYYLNKSREMLDN